ncbi:NAD(P)/FAD-dependent oxidoreductase [Pelagibius sp. Alg239-R121]|uniref:NAD(P)/FAD-dependent oxidoreductase n=1 Tax=Pelagibius sp. Alg239-R121 TaxID=2993448 RepID=UPI0024A6A6D0|nr:NAD(P)/FAD-dependent oxidoreductase [Pelagibius sp. Alg239-R121]
MERADAVVIGAGVVGLAVARRLAQTGRDVIVLEATASIGSETSSRNSEVIHAGIYYPQNSLKATLCVKGKEALYSYCESHGVLHRRLSKIIVASTPDEVPALSALKEKAENNDVRDLQWLDAGQARALEPEILVEAALLSPSTGIVDSHGLMLAFQGDAEDAGTMIAFNTTVLGGDVLEDGILLRVGGEAPMELMCRSVINASGLQAQDLAAAISGMLSEIIPMRRLAKGNYYLLAGASPFSRLVYPIPEQGGLGVHATIDLAGQCRFGPDVEWVEHLDYNVDPQRADRFYDAVRRYWPGLRDGALLPGYAGIRPKIASPQGDADFVIQGRGTHGVTGLINLFGIESPGLTASMAVADEVERMLREEG